MLNTSLHQVRYEKKKQTSFVFVMLAIMALLCLAGCGNNAKKTCSHNGELRYESISDEEHSVYCAECGAFLYNEAHDGNPCSKCGHSSGALNESDDTFSYQFDRDHAVYMVSDILDHDAMEITLPETFKGHPVDGIAMNAFFSVTGLKKLVLQKGQGILNIFNGQNCDDQRESIETQIEEVHFNTDDSLLSILKESDFGHISGEDGFKLYMNGSLVTDLEITTSKLDLPMLDYVNSIETMTFKASAGVVSGIGKHIKNVVIEEGITEIADSAFIENDSIESLEIPASVTKVGVSVFNYSTIKEITFLGEQDIEFGDGFSDLPCLTTITLPKNLKSMPSFYACPSLEEVVIPSGVTTIKKYAFLGCHSLMNVVIPASVTTIESDAFSDCDSLMNLVMPEGVETLGDTICEYCDHLVEITVPATVMSIAGSTSGDLYYSCPQMNVVHNRSALEIHVYNDCFVETGTVVTTEPTFEIINGFLFYKPGNSAVVYLLGMQGVYNQTIESLTLPEHYKGNGTYAIAGYAFVNLSCRELIIPSSVKGVNDNAFSTADIYVLRNYAGVALTEENGLAEAVRISTASRGGALEENDGYIFFVNASGVATLIGAPMQEEEISVDGINANTFYSMILPESYNGGDYYLGKLGHYRYMKLSIPAHVKGITDYAFCSVSSSKRDIELTIEERSTGLIIGKGAFKGCELTKALTIPSNSTIESEAFRGVTILSSGENETVLFFGENVSIKDSAFYDLRSGYIVSWGAANNYFDVIIPAGCTIGDSAFTYSMLRKVTILDKGTVVGANAFTHGNLVSAVIASEDIQEGAFSYCQYLGEVTFGDDVKRIGDRAFYESMSFSIMLPSGLYLIGDEAFANSSSSSRSGVIVLPDSLVTLGKNAFGTHFTNDFTVLIDADAAPAGFDQTVTSASFFKTGGMEVTGTDYRYKVKNDGVVIMDHLGTAADGKVVIPDALSEVPVTKIAADAFKNKTSLTSLTIPASVKEIESGAFTGCSGLVDIIVLGTLALTPEMVEGSAYKGTTKDGIKYIGNVVMGLDEVNKPSGDYLIIKDGATRIYAGVLRDISSYLGVYIPASVVTIESNNFVVIQDPEITGSIGDPSVLFFGASTQSYGSKAIAGIKMSDTGFLYTVNNDKATIRRYIGTATEVSVPSTLDGVAVGELIYAFYKNAKVSKITLAPSVPLTSHVATFYCCTALEEIAIAAPTASVGYVFYSQSIKGCDKLKKVSFTGEVYVNVMSSTGTGFIVMNQKVTTAEQLCTYLTDTYSANNCFLVGATA